MSKSYSLTIHKSLPYSENVAWQLAGSLKQGAGRNELLTHSLSGRQALGVVGAAGVGEASWVQKLALPLRLGAHHPWPPVLICNVSIRMPVH